MSSVKERLKAEIAEGENSAASSSETPVTNFTDLEERAKLQVKIALFVIM